MQCPQHNASTKVAEKRGPFRERHYTKLVCGIEFTMIEHLIPQQERIGCARSRAVKMGSLIPAVELVSAEAEGYRREEAHREPPAEAPK